MNLGQYTTSNETRRLSGQLQQRGSQSGLPTPILFLFAAVFFAVGCVIILIGTKVIVVDPKTVHAPHWVLAVTGVVFSFGGMMIWSLLWRQNVSARHAREAARLYPGEQALQDHKWDPRGHTPSRWAPVVKSIMGVLFLAVFLSMFNWWAFIKGGPFMVKAIVGLFDILLILFVGYTCVLFGRALKFGDSRIHFVQFPYRLSEPVDIRWQAAHGIARVNKGSFTLRCVKEYYEQRGRGKNRTRSMVHEEIWSGRWHFDEPRNFTFSEQIELRFEIPGDLPPTHLHANLPVFWELEVKLDLPGLDFVQHYLVPIYEAQQTSARTNIFP
ncbi:MAG: hypothetical protein H0X66_05885 [Verrucomicrobia bacterium]|nr:hypothetical protein [Verrucomicrobiota bacterium]